MDQQCKIAYLQRVYGKDIKARVIVQLAQDTDFTSPSALAFWDGWRAAREYEREARLIQSIVELG